ncbi:MAG: hypothetical protein H8E40_13380 [Chloroflexi bacterium]|nr:hypothetical protein [Chloroflexota bacterium]
MRKLYLIPIIHMSADMGSMASALEAGASVLGQELWQKHKGIVSGFWDSVAQFFAFMDVKGFRIYQDGLVANGPDGLRIVREGIDQGSKNYEIIGKLLGQGAVLEKTEDPVLVKQEYSYIAKIAHSKSPKEKQVWALRYKQAQNKLLRQRDDFMAARIAETLEEGETGILFIGAYHDVLSRMPEDIQVSQIKDIAKVREYHKTLLSLKKPSQHFHQLAGYLLLPIPSLLSQDFSHSGGER